MKLTFVFLLISMVTMANSTYSQAKKLTLKMENATIEEIFKEIEKQSGFRIAFNNTRVDVNKKMTLEFENQTIDHILNEILLNQGLRYEILDNYIIVSNTKTKEENTKIPSVSKQIAQPKTISGRVTDSGNSPLPGVSVIVKGSTTGTITNSNGEFTLSVPPGAEVLQFSFVGMKLLEVAIEGRTNIVVVMEEDVVGIEEVVAIGYGTQRKRDITAAITSIGTKQIDKFPTASISNVLQGKIAGLNITSNTGEPGGGVTVRLRGTGSLNSGSDPLYIIDGVQIQTENITELNAGGTAMNPLSYLDPSDIESIEVLKDGASAAIYGSRAANGVIIITTKRGKEGKAQVSLNLFSGFNTPANKLGVLNASQYRDLMLDTYINGLSDIPVRGTRDSLAIGYNHNHDMQDELMDPVLVQKYDLKVSGGSKTLRYAVSAGYLEQPGIIKGTEFNRFNTRTNVDYNPSEKLQVGTSFSYAQSQSNRTSQADATQFGSTISSIIAYPPTFPVMDFLTGYYMALPNDKLNPFAINEWVPMSNTQNRFTSNNYLHWKITDGLMLQTNTSFDMINSVEDIFYHKEVIKSGNHESEHVRKYNFHWANENILSYSKTFQEKHNLSIMGGITFYHWDAERDRIKGIGYASTTIRTTNAASSVIASNTIEKNSLMSYVGRLNYDFNRRYLFSATMRRDGSSRFGLNNRWGYFPSATAGWRFTDESFFMASRRFIDDGKLRISWGINGNESIGNYVAQGSYFPSARYLGLLSIAPVDIFNPSLKWEETSSLNYGLDLSFLNHAIELTADIYTKNTKDLLYRVTLPSTTGFGSYWANEGELENKGYELMLTVRPVTKKNFTWTSTLTFAQNKNKLKSIPGEIEKIEGVSIIRVGQPVGSFYGYTMEGVFPTDEDNRYYPAGHPEAGQKAPASYTGRTVKRVHFNGQEFKGGDVIFSDLSLDTLANGNFVIDARDRDIIGNAQPKFTGGWQNYFTYKNWSLDIFCYFVHGNDVYNQLRVQMEAMGNNINYGSSTLNRWRKPGDITDMPRALRGDAVQNARVSTRWVEDGSFFRLSNITLAYQMPSSLTQKFGLNRVRWYLQGQNLLTFSNYKGYDPEVNMDSGWKIGVDKGGYPTMKAVNLGLNLEF